MPSKLLIAAAEAAHAIRHAGRFGVHGGELARRWRGGDGPRAPRARPLRRLRRRRRARPGRPSTGCTARRASSTTTRWTSTATRACGPRASSSPPVRGRPCPTRGGSALGERLIVNDDVFAWQTLPRSVAVIGTGVVGLELAQALHRLGVRVRLYGRSGRIGPLTDPALQALAREVFAARAAADGAGRAARPRRATATRSSSHARRGRPARSRSASTGCSRPAAGGRTSTTLGLEHTTLPLRRRRRAACTTGAPGRSAAATSSSAGDAADDRPLLHEAADEGRIAGDNAGRWPDVRVRPRRTPLAVVFSDPQITLAGASHAELTPAGARLRHRRACRSRTRAAAA